MEILFDGLDEHPVSHIWGFIFGENGTPGETNQTSTGIGFTRPVKTCICRLLIEIASFLSIFIIGIL